MDLRKIKKLIELVEESDVRELEVKTGEESIRIARGEIARQSSAPTLTEKPTAASVDSGQVIAAPMAGTFYRSPAPGEHAFVTEGDKVTMGQGLCIIESMKMMNQIEADVAGRILSIEVENGEAVEYGQLLFVIG